MSSKALSPVNHFKQQIRQQSVQETLNEFLESEVLLKKFTAVTIVAVQEHPELLNADRTSLLLACQRAASDGLMPDGREGALVCYGKQVQWQPMILGIRKKLAQAGFDVRAEIVYKNDEFHYEQGDDPKIIHRPLVFDDRGPIVGAYAIATCLETGEKWRETMTIDELEKVRLSSRGKDSPAWKLWKTEMYRKTVAKRLRKYLPIADDSLLDLIDRDNEQFDMEKPQPSKAAQKVQDAVRASKQPIEGELVEPDEKPAPETKTKAKKAKKEASPSDEPDPDEPDPPTDEDYGDASESSEEDNPFDF